MSTNPTEQNVQLARFEALLFIHGEPLAKKKIGKIFGLGAEAIDGLLRAYAEKLAADDRGLTLIAQADAVQLATKPAFHSIIEDFVKSELTEDLSPASLETLAIVAYFGPLSRSRIDYQRGVNSSFILRSLLLRGLVERFPNPARPNTFLYQPTFELLRHLGIQNRESLPDYEKFKTLLDRVETQAPQTGDGAPPETPVEPAATEESAVG
jgi:segregation and condensation protein B